jgi:hypothetical protein
MAAACVAFDRFFGTSTGWMRCVKSAQGLQALLEAFQYDWIFANATAADKRTCLDDRLRLLRSFTEGITQIVREETAEWAHEFSASLAQLDASNKNTDHRQQ